MHTPGPYFPDLNGDNTIRTTDGFIVATVNPFASSFGNGEHIANQWLFAAAPELLASLEFVAKWFAMRESKGERFPSQLTGSVRAAIAKAKGETPANKPMQINAPNDQGLGHYGE